MEGTYHVWFSTKGRRAALDGDIGDEVKRLLIETARRTGIQLMETEAVADHVHLLVEVKGAQTLSSIATVSSILLPFQPAGLCVLCAASSRRSSFGFSLSMPSAMRAAMTGTSQRAASSVSSGRARR